MYIVIHPEGVVSVSCIMLKYEVNQIMSTAAKLNIVYIIYSASC